MERVLKFIVVLSNRNREHHGFGMIRVAIVQNY